MSAAPDLMSECLRRAAQAFDFNSEDDFGVYLSWAAQAALVVIAESIANHEQGAPDE